jgi:2-keto-4-pentenoate hydratase/2-oxohepta-3-ene-1,7-dioic acid hydratase in catechol pathway
MGELNQPSKIVCIGRNYREHAGELGNPVPVEPLIFLKPPSAIIQSAEPIVLPPSQVTQRVDFEGELAVVIAKQCRNLVDGDDVRAFIGGYTCANDVTARDLQNKDGQWTRAKGFDTFCPLGPTVAKGLDPWRGIRLETRVNGGVRQSGNTLFPGDLILTGTPAGVGPLAPGDVVEVTIEGIGTLRNPVKRIE